MTKNFNIIITGVGGQGIITLLRILAIGAALQELDIKTSELHGLSQRGGSIQAHARIALSKKENVFSPLVMPGRADLVLALEMTEALRTSPFINKKTNLLVNNKFISYFQGPSQKQVLKKLKAMPAKVVLAPASQVCQKEIGKEVLAGVYLLALASFKKMIPIEPSFILKAIKKVVPEEFLAINKKAFALAKPK